jgi:hypothetical protein
MPCKIVDDVEERGEERERGSCFANNHLMSETTSDKRKT